MFNGKRKRLAALLVVVTLITAAGGAWWYWQENRFNCPVGETAEVRKFDMTFSGEGRMWEADYRVYGTTIWEQTHYENQSKNEFRLRYKGPAPQSVGRIRYELDRVTGTTSSERPLPLDGEISSSGGATNGALPDENDIMHLTVQWQGQTERIELRMR